MLRLDISYDVPEISFRKINEFVEEFKRQKPESLISLKDPSKVVELRLEKEGGWHSDKISMDYGKYKERCKAASLQWRDALVELGLPIIT